MKRMTIKKVIKLLEEHGGAGTKTVPDDVMAEYLEGCKQALESVFVESKFKAPRPSSMNHGSRKLYYMINEPELFEGETIPYNLRNTFYQGHVLEAYIIALMRMAGVNIEAVQKYTEWDTGDAVVGGTLDYIIDGEVWDAKTANDRAYKTKWRGPASLKEHDLYGYIPQGAIYSNAENKKFAGWHVMNKNTGELKQIKADSIDFETESMGLVQTLKEATGKDVPGVCHAPVEEIYRPRGKPPIVTGNKHLHPNCAKCPVMAAGKCKPAEIVATGKRSSGNKVYYTEWRAGVNPNIKIKE